MMSTFIKLVNDLNRILAIYLISTPISHYLGIDISSPDVIRNDLLNDILAVMFYHEVVSYQGIQDLILSKWGGTAGAPRLLNNIIKTFSIIFFTAFLIGKLSIQTLAWSLVAIILYHLLVRPIINNTGLYRFFNIEAIEDLAETVILVSLDNAGPAEIVSKLVSLTAYHNLMKFSHPEVH